MCIFAPLLYISALLLCLFPPKKRQKEDKTKYLRNKIKKWHWSLSIHIGLEHEEYTPGKKETQINLHKNRSTSDKVPR